MSKKVLLLLSFLALTGIAAAGALTINQRDDSLSLLVERFTVGDAFTISGSRVSPVLGDMAAEGVFGDPVEMGIGNPAVRTQLEQDHWMYVATIKEKLAGGIELGEFEIELQMDGDVIDRLYMTQATPNPTGIEGVTAYFDLGETIEDSSLYYVVVRPVVAVGEIVEYVVRSEDEPFRWIGVGGEINNVENPELALTLGETLKLTGRNSDGGYHNIGLVDGDTELGPGFKLINANGQEAILTWTPTVVGTFTYKCAFHPGMEGDVVVAPDEA